MENQVDFKILPSDQFNVYSPATRSDKIITYFTLLSKLRGDILAVSSQEDPNNIVSAYYTNVGNTQTLHLVKGDGSEVTASNSFAGTVTSVDMSVPTGFAISGNPITTSGTLAVSFASGYSLPTNALQATWTTAYNRSITSAAVTGTSTKTLTLNQQDGGTVTASWTDQGLTSVGLTMPAAFNVANSPLTSNGTIAVTAAGLSSQYIRGDGQLANFPSAGGGGSAVNYYLNGSVNQGTFGGTTYYQLSKTPISGTGTNFTRTNGQGDGYIASFITDAGDPDLLNIPGGNWNLEFYFNSSSSGGSPAFYGELYKVSASNVFTLISSGSTNVEVISGGTAVDQYYTSIAVPQTTLLSTDRLAIRVYVIVDGRDITLHTEDNNFSEVITTFSTGLNALNGLTDQVQYFATGTSGTDFNISSATDTHTFNIPTASGTNRGLLSSSDWTTFNNKASDSFKTIAVTGQSNVVADSATDTLTFEAGSNIVITTDATNDKITITALGGGSGSVTSVDMSVPTGFSISGNPITTSGTLALAFASGYSLPTNASQANWDTAYNNSITAFSYNTSTGVLTLTQQDAGTLTATVTLQPFTTDNLTQGSTNLYDKVVSLTGAGTTVVTGTYPNFTITSNDQHVGTVTSIATSAPITGGTITTSGTIGITQSGTAADGYLSSTDWNTFNSKVGGSGTVNYVSKWTSTGAIGNSQIFDSGTYVGINTATPAAKLDISGAHVASIGLLRLNSSASNVAAQTYYIDGVYKAATYAGTDDNFYILGRDADIVFSTTSSTTTRMVITNGGNVGIGTSGPTQKLMVSGSIRVTGGYYDSSNSIGSNGQVLASTGSGTTWINASGGTVNGSGTVNYLSKWTGTTLLGDSLVYDNGTNVGVGTTAPGQKVDVVGAAATDTYLRVLGGAGTTKGGIIVGNNDSGKNYGSLFFDNANNNVYLYQQYSSGDLVLGTNTNEKMRITSGGNVGIGNTGPTQKLHVEGNIRVTGAYYDSANGAGSSGQVLSSTGSGTSWITPFSGSGTTNYVAKWTSGTALGNSQIFDNGTNVGIGTASPTETLDLRGVLRVSRSGVNDSGIIAFGNYVNGAGYYDNGIFRSALNAITTSGNTLHMGSYEALAFTTSANPLGSQSIRMYISGSNGNVGIGTTSPSRLLHVAGNAQVDGWLFQGGYYTGSVTLPYPGANYGNGRIYLRLCSSASGRIMTAKVRISSTWNWAPAFGSVEADISFYWNGSSLVYSYVNILSATGQAATNLTFGALEVEGGSISVPVYSTNSNPIYAYIQLSPDADPSQVSYSTWSSVAFPGQANVYIQTNLGVGTPSPAYRLDVNGTFHAGGDATFNGTNTYINSSYIYVGNNTSDLVSISGNTVYLPGDGNVGIGNTAPTQKLHVTGNVRVTGAYYDSSNAAGTSGQILSSTGTGTAWISPGGGGGIITGSGTTNYVTKWTSGTAVGDSSIFDNGNVGIGTTSPASLLHIYGSGNTFTRYTNTTSAGHYIDVGANGAGQSFIYGYGAYPLLFATNGSEAMRIASGGNVGIGNTNPEAKLHVSGLKSILSNYGVGSSQFFTYEIVTPTSSSTNQTFDMYMGRFGNGYHRVVLWGSGYGTDVGNYFDITRSWGTGSAPRIISNGGLYIGGATYTIHWAAVGNGQYDLFIKWTANMPAGYSNTISYAIQSNTGSGYTQFDYPSGVTVPTLNSSNLVDSVLTAAYNTGNVGIGNTSPTAKLQVGPEAHPSATGIEVAAGTGGANLLALNSSTNHNWFPYTDGSNYYSAVSHTFRNQLHSTDWMTITSAGNVGIGTTAPGFKTTISADITKSGDINPGTAQLSLEGATTPGKRMILGYDTNSNGFGFIKAGNYGVTWTPLSLQPDGGNVGIGETAPSQKLHVSGNIRVTGAYYDSANSAGTSGQILSSTGTGTAWIAAPSGGGVTGSGTTNYVTKWTSGSAVGNSSIYDNGNVGIGTTAPTARLTIGANTSVQSTNGIALGVGETSLEFVHATFQNGFGSKLYSVDSGGGITSLRIATRPNSTSWSDAVTIIAGTSGNGNVGIGTTSPNNALTINRDTGAGNISSMPGVVFRNKNTTNSIFVHSGIFADTYRDVSDPHYSGGIWFTRVPLASNLTSGSDIIFGTGGYVSSGAFPDERMRITWDGAVGIGATAPTTTLDVRRNVPASSGTFPVVRVGNSSGDWGNYSMIEASNVPDGRAVRFGAYLGSSAYSQGGFAVVTGDNGDIGTNPSIKLFVRHDGNVGIGTTAPSSKLTVTTSNRSFEDGENAIRIEYPGSPSNGEIGGGLVFAQRWFSGDPNSLIRTGGIYGVKTNGNGAFGGGLVFYTQPNSGDPMGERMRINSLGSVGINTTNPGYKLDVIGSVRSYGGLFSNGYHGDTYIENLLPAANNGSGQGDVQLRMWCSEPGITWSWAGFGYNVKNDGASPYGFGRVNTSFGQAYMRFSTDGNLYFYNANTSGTRVETMTLTNGGNVGIGTTSPSCKLTVDSSAGFSWGFPSTAAAKIGTPGTGGSLLVMTPSLNASYESGLAVDGTYSSGKTVVNINAFGVYSGGPYSADMVFKTSTNTTLSEKMRITNDGNVGIGTTAPGARLVVQSSVSSTEPTMFVQSGTSGVYGMIAASDAYHGLIMRGIPANQNNYSVTAQDSMSFFEYGGDFRFYTKGASFQLDAQINGGTGRFRGDVVAYYSFSDGRLKDDIKPLEGSLDKVLALQGVSYKWNSGERKGQSDIGLIAQQVEEVVPEVVREKTNIDGDTFKSVNYEHLVGVLIEAIKEQQKQIDELKAKLK